MHPASLSAGGSERRSAARRSAQGLVRPGSLEPAPPGTQNVSPPAARVERLGRGIGQRTVGSAGQRRLCVAGGDDAEWVHLGLLLSLFLYRYSTTDSLYR